MDNKNERSETFVPTILKNDGVVNNNFDNENQPITNIDDIIAQQDSSVSWSYRLVNTENNSSTLISQLPGEGNRLHFPSWLPTDQYGGRDHRYGAGST